MEVLRHNVVMLHSDQETVLVQLLKTVQNRRFERTSMRHARRINHQSQSTIENMNHFSFFSIVFSFFFSDIFLVFLFFIIFSFFFMFLLWVVLLFTFFCLVLPSFSSFLSAKQLEHAEGVAQTCDPNTPNHTSHECVRHSGFHEDS